MKILYHRGIVVSDLIGALAKLQLGTASALSGDTAKAKSAESSRHYVKDIDSARIEARIGSTPLTKLDELIKWTVVKHQLAV